MAHCSAAWKKRFHNARERQKHVHIKRLAAHLSPKDSQLFVSRSSQGAPHFEAISLLFFFFLPWNKVQTNLHACGKGVKEMGPCGGWIAGQCSVTEHVLPTVENIHICINDCSPALHLPSLLCGLSWQQATADSCALHGT